MRPRESPDKGLRHRGETILGSGILDETCHHCKPNVNHMGDKTTTPGTTTPRTITTVGQLPLRSEIQI